ncbi:sugar phosphate isomerase/epimerase family protein [Ruminiclostridium sufflavum]|nr:sugar phosphate isomerase/epimerase family protein [Ruminiclostridium sufflavum]
MLSTARDIGFDGIEIRGIENEMYAPSIKQFSAEDIDLTKKKIAKIGIEIPCLSSACYLFDKTNIDKQLQEGTEYIELAAKLETPYVRVLGDAQPKPGDVDIEFVLENLKKLTDIATPKGIKILIETNGVFADSKVLRSLITAVDSDNVGVLWDIHHPFRFFDEPVEYTFENLKDYICFLHVKDSLVIDGIVKYKKMGYGDIPIKTIIRLLKENDYKGYISVEWIKRWCIDLEEPEIVFSHFAGYMKGLI